jgi:hypothetical protein
METAKVKQAVKYETGGNKLIMILIMLTLALAAQPVFDVTPAWKEARQRQVPMLVMFSSASCQPCFRWKAEVLPRLRENRLHGQYTIAIIDIDREPEAAAGFHGTIPVSLPTFMVWYPVGARGKITWKSIERVGFLAENDTIEFVLRGLDRSALSIDTGSGPLPVPKW